MKLNLIISYKNSNISNVYFRAKMVELVFQDYQVCLSSNIYFINNTFFSF
jgi:hypothetical protein